VSDARRIEGQDSLLTVRELAKYLAVHEKTIHRWRRSEALPCVVIGGRVRFVPRDVIRWLEARKEG
jgi:excisionase family DNA binding protein